MVWPLVVAAIAAAVIQQYNQAKTAKRQDKAAAASIRTQAETQREANKRMNEQLDTLQDSTPADEKATRSSQIRTQLKRNQSMALAGLNPTGGGEAVTNMVDSAGRQAVDYGGFINESLSGIDAPLLQRQGEAFDRADVEGDLNRLRRNSAQEGNLLRLRQAGIRDNPWLSLLSTGLSAYAGSGGFGGGKTMAGSGTGAVVPGSIQSPQTFFNVNSGASLPGLTNQTFRKPIVGSIFGP
jgi:hypothetical protein